VERHGDVVRLAMISVGGRAIGLGVSTYVIGGVMIDSGFPRAESTLVRAVRELGVRAAIITHWHEDHAGNVDALAAAGIPIVLRDDTASIVRRAAPIQLYRRVVWGQPRPLASEVRAFDVGELQTIHTPGHSPDHQVVWDPRTRTLFSGDLWLGVRARVMHRAENPYGILESLKRVLTLAPERMFDAHRGLVKDPVRAIQLKIDWLSETVERIEERVVRGESDRDIVRGVLGGEEMAAFVSRGEYSRRNLVKAVRRAMDAASGERL
jgi:glyoxylase-like metal-dependent hydrolase (beta-lactamase superfamily II)